MGFSIWMYSFDFHSWNVRSESSLISSFQQTLPSKYFLLCSDTFLTFCMYIAFLIENSFDEAYVFLYFLTKLWNWKSEAMFWVSNSVARYICKIEVSNKYVLQVQKIVPVKQILISNSTSWKFIQIKYFKYLFYWLFNSLLAHSSPIHRKALISNFFSYHFCDFLNLYLSINLFVNHWLPFWP